MTEGLDNQPFSVPRQHTFSMQPMGGQTLAVFTQSSSGKFQFRAPPLPSVYKLAHLRCLRLCVCVCRLFSTQMVRESARKRARLKADSTTTQFIPELAIGSLTRRCFFGLQGLFCGCC